MDEKKGVDNGPRMAPHSVLYLHEKRRKRPPLQVDQVLDLLFLLVSGCLAATLAWLFWHFAAQAAIPLLTAAISLAMAVDNWRLRRQIRELNKQGASETTEAKRKP